MFFKHICLFRFRDCIYWILYWFASAVAIATCKFTQAILEQCRNIQRRLSFLWIFFTPFPSPVDFFLFISFSCLHSILFNFTPRSHFLDYVTCVWLSVLCPTQKVLVTIYFFLYPQTVILLIQNYCSLQSPQSLKYQHNLYNQHHGQRCLSGLMGLEDARIGLNSAIKLKENTYYFVHMKD